VNIVKNAVVLFFLCTVSHTSKASMWSEIIEWVNQFQQNKNEKNNFSNDALFKIINDFIMLKPRTSEKLDSLCNQEYFLAIIIRDFINQMKNNEEFSVGDEKFNKIEEMANNGDAVAQFILFFIHNSKSRKDLLKSHDYLEKSSNQNNPLAEFFMAILYENGDNLCEKNSQKSLEYIKRSATHGLLVAQFLLGVIYLEGNKELLKDYKKALEYFEKAANQGYFAAYEQLSYMHFVGKGILRNKKESAVLIKKAITLLNDSTSDINYINLFCNLSDKMEHSELLKKDIEEELEWLKLCSEMGYVRATMELGKRLITNYTNPYKMEEGRKYLEKAAGQKDPRAYYYLGADYYGVYKNDYKQAIVFLKKALTLGVKEAESTIQIFERFDVLGK
jgi:TPR repeat protein